MMICLLARYLRVSVQLGCAAPAAVLLAAAAVAVTPGASPEPSQGRRIDSAADYAVLPPHERVEPENRILTERLERLLPVLMTEAGLDMWVVVNREYAEDPVYFTLVPQPSFAARRTTMLVFSRAADGTVERLAVNRYPLGGPYKSAWSGGDLDAQWKALGVLIAGREPKRIGIDVSRTWPAADGLTHALHEQEGRSGNEILAATIKGCAAAGLACSTYSHPLGFFGHSLGPTIGMWDNQGPTPGTGDYPLHRDTVYAIEGNVAVSLAEWDGQRVQIMLEQGALFDGKGVRYLAGRQTDWHLIR
jgi:hypothetical protein